MIEYYLPCIASLLTALAVFDWELWRNTLPFWYHNNKRHQQNRKFKYKRTEGRRERGRAEKQTATNKQFSLMQSTLFCVMVCVFLYVSNKQQKTATLKISISFDILCRGLREKSPLQWMWSSISASSLKSIITPDFI
jgi:hypothetical protein